MNRPAIATPAIFIIAIALAVAATTVIGYKSHRKALSEEASVAVGLRGNNRVSKPMSARQQDRFENYFLETPAVPQRSSVSPAPSAITQAHAINAFNQSQNR